MTTENVRRPTDPSPLGEEELAEIEVSWPERYGRETVLRLIAALRAKDEELRKLRVEATAMGEIAREWEERADSARLLGPARVVLDRVAASEWDEESVRDEAAGMAQRIVDLIGHPVTDEPPHALVERDELRAEVERLREQNDGLYQATLMLKAEVERLRAERDEWRDAHRAEFDG